MEKKILNVKIPENPNNFRVDKFLQSKLDQLSRTKIQSMIQDGFIKINSRIVKNASKKVKNDDMIEVNFPPPKKENVKPYKISLNILYDDSDIILINKAPGMVMHPGAGNYEKTLVNALLYYYKNNLSSVGGNLRPGIVHRIDKDTSGVIVVAKNDFAHVKLSEQFVNHSIKRTYETLVWGVLRPKNGKIVENISRSYKNRKLMSVKKGSGKKAITNYKTLEIFQNANLPKISLVECSLETGRTHQIRVHMKFKGNPVLGDKSYGKSKKFKTINPEIEKKIINFDRQALHAKSLGLIHPRTGKEIYYEARRPEDFNSLIKNLKKASI